MFKCVKDLNDIDVNNSPKHNLLCGGFHVSHLVFFKDTRSNVFWKILDILHLLTFKTPTYL